MHEIIPQLMNKHKTHSTKDKLAELISANPKLLLLLPRFGITLGFGDHSIGEVCQSCGIDARLFTLICNVYSDPDFIPQSDDFSQSDMTALLPYLLASHRYYLDDRFPHIEAHLSRIIEAGGAKYGNMLQHFYNEYKQEVEKHFRYEENIVFPYIEALRKGQDTEYSIEQFRDNHSNIEDPLSDMMNILVKYLPADILPKERIEISLDIKELTDDLNSHSLIEERVLIPYVESLENAKP